MENNLSKFARREKREVKKLLSGQERLAVFFRHTGRLFYDFLIPHQGNNHKPHALRHHALISYVMVAVIIKMLATGYLFFTYPTPAHMARVIGSRVIELANEARVAHGLPELTVSPILADTALLKGQDMLTRGYFAHDTPEGKKPWEWIDKQSYDYIYAGENLAMGFTDAGMVHDAFMESPGHRRNILNSNYQNIGVAVISGQMLGQETDVLVMYFGTTRPDYLVARAQDTIEAKESVVTEGAIEVAEVPPVNLPTLEPLADASANVAAVAGLTLLGEGIDDVGPITVAVSRNSSLVTEMSRWANIFILAFILFVLFALALNIFVHVRVQHGTVVFQSLFAVAVMSSIFLSKFHFLEKIASRLTIS